MENSQVSNEIYMYPKNFINIISQEEFILPLKVRTNSNDDSLVYTANVPHYNYSAIDNLKLIVEYDNVING